MLLFLPAAYAQEDTEFRGFIENATFVRQHGVGISKSRTTLQLELSRAFNPTGLFSEVSISSTFRGSYDAVNSEKIPAAQ
jgi:UDP-N-acetyl-D-mannosaminuronic acid transferase (WecB/TagA/CpsF family)